MRPFSMTGSIGLGLLLAALELVTTSAVALPSAPTIAASLPIALLALPFAYWLPIARARSLGAVWHVPRSTYMLSRGIVCIVATSILGQLIAFVVLALAVDRRYALPLVSLVFLTSAFIASASKRFVSHPSSEFVMPPPFARLLRFVGMRSSRARSV